MVFNSREMLARFTFFCLPLRIIAKMQEFGASTKLIVVSHVAIKDKNVAPLCSSRCEYVLVMQVGQFANCLIEARNELQHKYVAISLSKISLELC